MKTASHGKFMMYIRYESLVRPQQRNLLSLQKWSIAHGPDPDAAQFYQSSLSSSEMDKDGAGAAVPEVTTGGV